MRAGPTVDAMCGEARGRVARMPYGSLTGGAMPSGGPIRTMCCGSTTRGLLRVIQ